MCAKLSELQQFGVSSIIWLTFPFIEELKNESGETICKQGYPNFALNCNMSLLLLSPQLCFDAFVALHEKLSGSLLHRQCH